MRDCGLLVEILAELRGLRADMMAANELSSQRLTQPGEADLLRAIAATTEGLKFTVSELLLHAEVVADRAADQRLHDAIVAAVGAINGRRLGKLLRRVEGSNIDGLCVIRVGADRDGVSWRVCGFAVLKTAITVAS